MAKTIGSLPLGSKIIDPNTSFPVLSSRYENIDPEVIVWRLIDINHPGYPENSATLITEYMISHGKYDYAEPTNPDLYVADRGRANWKESNIRQWLNANTGGNTWFNPIDSYDVAPGYDLQAGFLTYFSDNLKSKILNTTVPYVYYATGASEPTQDTTIDKIFFPSEAELTGYDSADGVMFPQDSINQYTYFAGPPSIKYGYTPYAHNTFFATRTADTTVYIYFHGSSASMKLRWASLANHAYGIRPMMNITTSTLVTDSPNVDGYYEILEGSGGTTETIPTVSGADNDLGILSTWTNDITYSVNDSDATTVLDVTVKYDDIVISTINDAVRNQTYMIDKATIEPYFNDSKQGTHKITIFVTNSSNSATRTYTFSKDNLPSIDGSTNNTNTDFGYCETAPDITYIVDDADVSTGQSITITEYFNTTQLNSFPLTMRNEAFTFGIGNTFDNAPLNVVNTYKVTVNSGTKSVTKSFTFTKSDIPVIQSSQSEEMGNFTQFPTIEYTISDPNSTRALSSKMYYKVDTNAYTEYSLGSIDNVQRNVVYQIPNLQDTLDSMNIGSTLSIKIDVTYYADGTNKVISKVWNIVKSNNPIKYISGFDYGLVDSSALPTITYDVRDIDTGSDSELLTVTEKFNDVTLRTYSATNYNVDNLATYTVADYSSEFNSVNSGQHKIDIVVDDGYGAVVQRTYTLEKGNNIPTISGGDTNLGVVVSIPEITYYVDDVDASQTLSVTEYFDNEVISSFNADRNINYTMDATILDNKFNSTSGGTHIIKVVVDDGFDTATRTWTFIKSNYVEISNVTTDYGNKNNPFNISFTVSNSFDTASTNLKGFIEINGMIVQTYKGLSSGTNVTYSMDSFIWSKIAEGNNQIRIHFTDGEEYPADAYSTFNKVFNKVNVKLMHPLITEELAEHICVNLNIDLAPEAQLQVLATNNGASENVVWEDITNAVLNGNRYTFSNTTGEPAIDIKVIIFKNNSTKVNKLHGFGFSFD